MKMRNAGKMQENCVRRSKKLRAVVRRNVKGGNLMMEKSDTQAAVFEEVWGESGAANIISGIIAAPFCTAYLAVSDDAVQNANRLNTLMKSLYGREMYEEMLLLLDILYDLIGVDLPKELAAASKAPAEYSTLLKELMLDYDEILNEEIA